MPCSVAMRFTSRSSWISDSESFIAMWVGTLKQCWLERCRGWIVYRTAQSHHTPSCRPQRQASLARHQVVPGAHPPSVMKPSPREGRASRTCWPYWPAENAVAADCKKGDRRPRGTQMRSAVQRDLGQICARFADQVFNSQMRAMCVIVGFLAAGGENSTLRGVLFPHRARHVTAAAW